jgi:ATP-dependent DNA helicase RecQ
MIVFTEERLTKKNLYISPENYKKRKEQYISKINSVIDYATNDNKCRSIQLLEYFGEKDAYRCGFCDVCNKRNELELSKYQFDTILQQMKDKLKDTPYSLDELIDSLDFKKEKTIKVFNWLLEHNKIIKSPDNKYSWNLKN